MCKISCFYVEREQFYAKLLHYMVHELGPTIFELAAPPVLQRFFCWFLRFSISIFYFNLFPASKSVRLAWKQHAL